MPAGRPTTYNAEMMELILERVAEGEGLRTICRGEGFSNRSTVRHWIDNVEGVKDRFALARTFGLEVWAEEILSIADDSSNDTIKDAQGNMMINFDHIQRSKLRVASRQWLLTKLLPKQYGDKVVQEITGAEGTPFPVMVYLPSNGRDKPEEDDAEA